MKKNLGNCSCSSSSSRCSWWRWRCSRKTEFDVELTSAGSSKIKVVKAVKEATGLGLKDAKELVDGAPKVIKEALPKEEAEKLKEQLEEVGATVELK